MGYVKDIRSFSNYTAVNETATYGVTLGIKHNMAWMESGVLSPFRRS